MDKINIDKKFFDGFTPIYGNGNESLVLYKDDIVAKLIYKNLLRDDRELITKNLESLDHDGLVKPTALLYEKQQYKGYLMKYLKDNKSLFDLITDNIDTEVIPFNERKELMLNLCQIFDYFTSEKYAYFDVHGDNFLLKDGKLNIVDLDSGVFKGTKNNGVDYNMGIRMQTKHLTRYALSFLYNLSTESFTYIARKSPKIYKELPVRLVRIYEYALDKDYSVYEGISDAIDSIDENVYYKTKKVLKKKIKY